MKLAFEAAGKTGHEAGNLNDLSEIPRPQMIEHTEGMAYDSALKTRSQERAYR